MRAHLVVLLLAVSALTACSGGEESPAEGASSSAEKVNEQWRAAVEDALGTTNVDLEALQAQAAVDCERTDVPNWIVSLGTSGDVSTSKTTRIGLEHLCPEVSESFDAAATQVEDAPDVNSLVCAQPAAGLGTDERMKVDFIC